MSHRYQKIECKVALQKSKKFILPHHWKMNIRHGCDDDCLCCNAPFSHQCLGNAEGCHDVFIKINIIERLEKQPFSSYRKKDVINLGKRSASDQKVKSIYQFMPDISTTLMNHKNPIVISTKSNLILQDYDLVAELSQVADVNIKVSITTMDESLREVLEPGGTSSANRFAVLKAFRQTNATVGVHLMPIIPFLNDSYENIDALFAEAKHCKVHYTLASILSLHRSSREPFFRFIHSHFPQFASKLSLLYTKETIDSIYQHNLYTMVSHLKQKHQLSGHYKASKQSSNLAEAVLF